MMKKGHYPILAILVFLLGISQGMAQIGSTSDHLVAQPIPDRLVPYSLSDSGEYLPITWGLDLAWLSEANVRRGVGFMGADRVDVIRSSFTPTAALVNGELQAVELGRLNQRIGIINTWLAPETKVVLNSDHPSVDPYFQGNAANWAELIEVTARIHQDSGREIITVSPFNEPDYSATGQGTINDFYAICGELRNNSFFDSIRISGGNTLNCDEAFPWYDFLKDRLDEGNTHQLAGNFDNYAAFFQAVRANGDHATNDELHNVMECMVGAEYGMQTGIWWGTAELARGEFVKASDGRRLAYAEHRPNWTAASVYRTLDGKIQAFGGTSERQAATTTYSFVSKEQVVYYDGYGPYHEYVVEMPGGTGYQQGQTNAECVINVTWGEDIQPVIDGRYVLVNRATGKIMQVLGNAGQNGANVFTGDYAGTTKQQWDVEPVPATIGGDFSYFRIQPASNATKSLDLNNFSLDNGANIHQWANGNGGNQQWYLEYAGDGWFYIRSRESSYCIDLASTGNVIQWEKRDSLSQQWRFVPVGAAIEFDAPAEASNLMATAQTASVRLDWTASPNADVAGYTIFRADSAGGAYNTIARNVAATSFVDNTAINGGPYFYAIKAVDSSLNRSGYSNEVSAAATGGDDLIAQLEYNGNTLDSSPHLNHSATAGTISYYGQPGEEAIVLDGTSSFIQLPANLPHVEEITVATWVYWQGGRATQRIFDFGNNENERMYLTASLDFAIEQDGTEESIAGSILPFNQWAHVALTLDSTGARIYLNGELDGEASVTLSPMDIKPLLNFIGRSHSDDPLFKGYFDDFRVYNYAMDSSDVALLSEGEHATNVDDMFGSEVAVWPVPADEMLHLTLGDASSFPSASVSILDLSGRVVMDTHFPTSQEATLNVSTLPSGVYFLKVTRGSATTTKKLIIKH